MHLTTTITSHNIPCTDVDIWALEDTVNTLQTLIPEIIKTIEEADREQCLFFDLPTSPHPLKIPSYSGTFSKDFTAFERNFNEAAKDNKVSRTDQLGILRSALQGNAKHYIYLEGEMSIDHAWAKLREAYGDPQKHAYRWSPEERRRLLDTKAEHEGDIENRQQGPRPTTYLNKNLNPDTDVLLTQNQTSTPARVNTAAVEAKQTTLGQPRTENRSLDIEALEKAGLQEKISDMEDRLKEVPTL